MSKTFLDLPFRVVVNDIFPFIIMKTSLCGELDLFGYFKKDITRKLFFIFPSILFNSGDKMGEEPCILKLSKIQFLVFDNSSKKFVEHISQNSSKMINVIKLNIRCLRRSRNQRIPLLTNIFNIDSFPRLEELEIDGNDINCEKWNRANKMWSNLKKFYYYFSSHEFKKNEALEFFRTTIFDNLKVIDILGGGSNEYPKNVTINLPNIEKIFTRGFRGLTLKTGKKVKSYVSINSDPRTLKDVFCDNDMNIESLQIHCSSSTNEDFSFVFKHQNFQKLKSMEIDNYVFSQDTKKTIKFPESISELSINYCKNFDEDMISGSLPNLKKLIMKKTSSEFTGEKNMGYPWTKNLEVLELSCCLSGGSFWLRNEFPKLRRLELEQTTFIGDYTFKNSFQELKSIVLNAIRVDDSFFEMNSFPSLENLSMSWCPYIKALSPEKWNLECSRIKTLVLCNLEKFDLDSFLSKQEFVNLISLKIQKTKTSTGKNWRPIKNLEELSVSNCKDFDDTLFQDNKLEELTNLEISDCERVIGCDWNFLPKVDYLRIYKCEKIGEEFWDSKSPFRKGIKNLGMWG